MTIPFSFVAERWGVKTVLWCNLVPRMFMSVWAITVGKNVLDKISQSILMLRQGIITVYYLRKRYWLVHFWPS